MRRNGGGWRLIAAVLVGNALGNLVARQWAAAWLPWLTQGLGPSLEPFTLAVPYLGALTFGLRLEVTAGGLLGILIALAWLRRQR
ncbi:2-keto-3-deoxygluconate permease [Thermaerobacter litoralis]